MRFEESSSSNFCVNCVCHWSERLISFLDWSSGESERIEPDDANEVGTVLPFWCNLSKPFTIFSMFFNSDAGEFLWSNVPLPFLLRSLLLFVTGTCGVKADEDCCDKGRWLAGEGEADWGRLLDGELELALGLCDGLLLRLLSGGLSLFALDWPGVTASKAEPWWKPGRLYGENRWALRLCNGDVGEWPE